MTEKISEVVSVSLSFNHRTKKTIPRKVLWRGRIYEITKVGLYHTYRKGRTLYHVFSVSTQTIFLRLVFNSETLFWKLEEVSD